MIPDQATIDNAKAKIAETVADPVEEEPEDAGEGSEEESASQDAGETPEE